MSPEEIDDVYEERYRRGIDGCPEDSPERKEVEYYAEHEARHAVASAMQERCVAAVRQVDLGLEPGVADRTKNALMRVFKEGWYPGGAPSYVTDTIHWNKKDHVVKWQVTLGGDPGVEIHLYGGRSIKMTIPEWIVLAQYAIRDAAWSQKIARLFLAQELGRAAMTIRDILSGLEGTYKGAIERMEAAAAEELEREPRAAP